MTDRGGKDERGKDLYSALQKIEERGQSKEKEGFFSSLFKKKKKD